MRTIIFFWTLQYFYLPIVHGQINNEPEKESYFIASKVFDLKNEKILFGVIDRKGKFTIEPKYSEIKELSFKIFALKDNNSGLFAISTEKGLPKTGFIYNQIYSFAENGLSRFERNGLWGFVDMYGNEIITSKYEFVHAFTDELAPVKFGDHYGYLSKSGKLAINPIFKYFNDKKYSWGKDELSYKTIFSYKRAVFKSGEKYGYIGINGNVVIKPMFDVATPYNNAGIAVVGKKLFKIPTRIKNDRNSSAPNSVLTSDDFEYFLIDEQGIELSNSRFALIGEYYQHLAPVILLIKKTKKEYEDSLRKEVMKAKSRVNFKVKSSSKVFSVNDMLKHYYELLAAELTQCIKDNNESIYCFRGKMGYINYVGDLKIEPKFSYDTENDLYMSHFSDGLALVTTGTVRNEFKNSLKFPGNKYGYIDTNGKFIIKEQFYPLDNWRSSSINEGLAAISLQKFRVFSSSTEPNPNYVGFIGKDGSFFIPPIYAYAYPFKNGIASVFGRFDCLYQGSCFIDKKGNYIYYDQDAKK